MFWGVELYFDKLELTFTVQHPPSQTYKPYKSCFTISGEDGDFFLLL